MSGYVGTSADASRIRKQMDQREKEKQEFEAQKKRKEENVANGGLRQFGTSAAEAVDEQFRKETVGLVTREEFASKRKTIEKRLLDEAEAAKEAERKAEQKAKEDREKKRMSKLAAARLSFLGGDDEDEEEEEEEEGGFAAMVAPPAKKGKFGKVGKNPHVDTSFLPDRDREREEQDAVEKLKREYTEREEAEKNKPLDITFSYWDGSGHRRSITIKQGDSIGEFLGSVRRQLSKEFRNLRATSQENLIYVKEDLMIPQHFTFHELIVTKARGKSGPLFHFDVHDDIRLVNDATKEKEESHAGKIVERHWYEKNKHIFPASRWEVYDPAKKYETYTIHGD